MKKVYPLICPAIDGGRGKTRQLIETLRNLWRSGKHEGAGEICAVVDALSDAEKLPYAFKPVEGSPAEGFLREFLQFLGASDWRRSACARRIIAERGEEQVLLHAAGLANATGALHAAMQALGVCGGEVITTSLNYIGVVNAILLAGARPRFVDVDRRTWCMDPDAARQALSSETRAVLLTHLNHFADLEPFYDLCETGGRRLPLVQDASLAIGSRREGVRPGFLNIGRPGATVMSLTISKILSGMGGAVLVSDSRDVVERVQAIANQGLNRWNENAVEEVGANYKFSVLHASIAREMLTRFDAIVSRRSELRALFDAALAPLVSEGLLEVQALTAEDVVTHYGILLPHGVDWRALASELLTRHGITSGRWHCLHQEGIFRQIAGADELSLPITEAIGERLLFLPFYAGLSDDDARFICEKTVHEITRLVKAS